ncbi:MAG: NUDIX domain-containing protein [Deltaproteobacteria bacterium]|nr:NUDIX domain-containing protein [Deltaproteobacteria bacterium]
MPEIKNTRTLNVVAGIIEKEGKILIAKRKATRCRESRWEFPGGKIEKGESPEECLVREIREELELEIKVKKCVSVEMHEICSGRKIILHAYEAEYLSGTLCLKEHEDAKWVRKEDLLNFDFYEPDFKIARNLVKSF